MSQSKTPTSPWVIPVYEHMKNHLTKSSQNDVLPPSLRYAASKGLEKLSKYYSKAMECPHLILATRELTCKLLILTNGIPVLHPHLGIRWFRKVDPVRAEKAKVILEHAFNEYSHRYAPKIDPRPNTAPKRTASSNGFLDSLCLVDVEIDDSSISPTVSELDRFMAIDQHFGLGDRDYPLLWWRVRFTTISMSRHLLI